MDPETVRSQRFLLVRRGYDPEAVHEFLDDVADALEALREAGDGDADDPGTVEVADARREVDEARTRAATHRLRAQRDVEALERTARQRRARLLAEIEELAAARDQLSTDLDRAVDVVDRVVQWVRRTDPGATAAPPGAVAATQPSMTDGADDQSVPDEPDDEEQRPVDVEADEEQPEEVEPVDGRPEQESEGKPVDVEHDEQPDEPMEDAAPEADDEPADDEPADDEPDDRAPEDEPEALAADLPDDDVVALPEDPVVAAVREALRAVQDEVLANLRDAPRGDVAGWLPGPARLEALDDAATPAAHAAFRDGWASAQGPDDDADGGDGAAAREALEEVTGAGHLPGLDVAGDLAVALEATLGRGRDAGDTEVALRERVAEVHRDLRQTRLPDAVERVLSAARHHGQLARWRHDGITAVAWVVGQEQRCPGRRCRGNATDGVVPPGEPFAFGDLVPPAHPGCTCTLRPAGPDEQPG